MGILCTVVCVWVSNGTHVTVAGCSNLVGLHKFLNLKQVKKRISGDAANF